MCVNCKDGICQNRCQPLKKVIVCDRCNTEVIKEPDMVSDGYYAYCPTHDEDLLKIETKELLK